MEFFKSFIGVMVYASLGFTVAAAYLKLNKIWKRKHNAEVADSVSIVGNVIYIIPLTFFALNYILITHWQGLIDSVIWIASGIIYILIGSRLWVHSHRHKSFWARLQEVLKLGGCRSWRRKEGDQGHQPNNCGCFFGHEG